MRVILFIALFVGAAHGATIMVPEVNIEAFASSSASTSSSSSFSHSFGISSPCVERVVEPCEVVEIVEEPCEVVEIVKEPVVEITEVKTPEVIGAFEINAKASASSSASTSSSSSFSHNFEISSPCVERVVEPCEVVEIVEEPCEVVEIVKEPVVEIVEVKTPEVVGAFDVSASTSSSSSFSHSFEISSPCVERVVEPCEVVEIIEEPCEVVEIVNEPVVEIAEVKTPEIVVEKVIEPEVIEDVVVPCGERVIIEKPKMKIRARASASASGRVSGSFRRGCVRKPRVPCQQRRRVGIPCSKRTVTPCEPRIGVPCIEKTQRPCAPRKIVRRKMSACANARISASGRQAPLCFRPTADMLRGKDLVETVLTVRGMEWKCVPENVGAPVPNKLSILPDPCEGLPAGRVIECACGKTLEPCALP